MWAFWLLVAGICFIIEIFTVGFFVFWFGVGALIALVVSLFVENLLVQAVCFVIASTILLLFTKPLVNKFIKTDKITLTNVYRIIDKEGIVIEDIDSLNCTGKVKVKGELWSAIADTDIEKGSKIKVISVNGVKLKVEKISSPVNSN